MRISEKGLELIKRFEGCRLTAYRCAAGVWTIGYGHTVGVKSGQKIAQAQADAYLIEDVSKYEDKVNNYDSKYNWNQNEFDALVSFAFNLGNIDQLTANGTRQRKVISDKFLLYNKAAGNVIAGLVERRKAEQALFNMPVKKAELRYSSHSADKGWQDYVKAGNIAGVKGKQLEALKIDTGGLNMTIQVHVQDMGWMPAVSGCGILTVGITGQGKAIEAIKIFCSDKGATYKVHTLNGKWSSPVWNGGQAGTTGKARAIDLVQITF